MSLSTVAAAAALYREYSEHAAKCAELIVRLERMHLTRAEHARALRLSADPVDVPADPFVGLPRA